MATRKPKILITGATGQVGREVLKRLTDDKALDVAASSRAPAKAADLGVPVVLLDYDRRETIAPARRETLVKVLWVDDHPQNNIGLQYAFQALGMVVICIDSNAGIQEAFTTADGFDVVITDMYRDAIKDRPGLQTVDIIRKQHPGVPVVIYAGSYTAAHANEPVSSPVIADTNDTRRVFTIVADIAPKKTKWGTKPLASLKVAASSFNISCADHRNEAPLGLYRERPR